MNNSKRRKGEDGKDFFNRSLERALQIMCAFNTDKNAYTLTQLAEAVGLPKATTTRLCSTLVKYNFMKFDNESMQYSLGIKLFELGSVVYTSFSLKNIAYPYLHQLQVRSGKASFLGILDNDELVYLDKKEGMANPIRFASQVGNIRPPYFGMLGQVLMAYMPGDEVDRILEKKPLSAFTKRSITDPYEFREKLALIKKQGYAVDEGGSINGITGIAAPVHNFSGDVVAAVGVGFISSSLDDKGSEGLIAEVLKTAGLISREMGYNGVLPRSHKTRKTRK